MKCCDKFYNSRIKAENWSEDDICDPGTPAQEGLNILIDYLLGPDWYVSMPENGEQTNTAAIYQILREYVDEPRKDNFFFAISVVLNLVLLFIHYF